MTTGKAHQALALEGYWTGQPRQGITDGRRAVSLLERIGEQYFLGQAHRTLGLNHSLLGEFGAALEALAAAAAIGESTGDSRLQSYTTWTIGWFEAMRGDGAAGVAACQQGLRRSLDPANAVFALGHLGAAHLEQGDVAEAVPLLEQAVEQSRQLGFRRIQA